MGDGCLTRTTILCDKLCFCSHFTDEETEAARGKGSKVTQPGRDRVGIQTAACTRSCLPSNQLDLPASLSWGLCAGTAPVQRALEPPHLTS